VSFCLNCHGGNWNWAITGKKQRCPFCGHVYDERDVNRAIDSAITAKVEGLIYELRTLTRINLQNFAWDGQLITVRALMEDVVGMRQLQLAGKGQEATPYDDGGT